MKAQALVCILAAAAMTAVTGKTETIKFDSASPGSLPPGWTQAMTHKGGAPLWEVRKDDTAPSKPNVLAQLSNDRASGRFPLAIFGGASFKDGELSVKFKPISGEEDQAGGMVWRYRDENNYYLTRANALEDNVNLYYVKDGRRKQITGWRGKVTSGSWRELSVEATGDHLEVYWEGTRIIDAHDKTFADAGKIGVWTKADSVTYFDDLSATALGGQP